jgi:hypothetical protein
MFSALTVDDQRTVIDRCLDPLLELADKGFRFGLQVSGVSLEIIYDYRPDLARKITRLIREKKIDFIGNGYAQIIQPLFPHELNLQNQTLGQKTYQDIVGYAPDICTVNEMAYSAGSCESILEAGYSTILMEWNNARAIINTESVDQFSTSKTLIEDKEIDILWCDTVAFQKFQKYTHGEIDIDSYCDWLASYTIGRDGALCLYCSDAEIFGFRPKRYGTEITPTLDEWERIEFLMKRLQDATILPSSVAKPIGEPVQLTNAENPIIVKKQQKYNINRWGITGRGDHSLNTFCYRLFNHAKSLGSSFSNDDWKNLLKLSSSDLRTHIEDQRWKNAEKIRRGFEQRFGDVMYQVNSISSNHMTGDATVEVDRKRGNNIISWPSTSPVFGRVESGMFPKTSLMADFYSGYAVIEKLGHRKISDLDYEASNTNYENYNNFRNNSGYEIKKTIFSNNYNTLDVAVSILVPKRTREQIKPCNFSLTSEHWDVDSLYYSTNLGGVSVEKFEFGRNSFDQDSILNLNVVGTNGFCPTDGVFIIGDKDKKICFQIDPTQCFSLVRLSYDVVEETKFLLQLSFVVQDIDETFQENDCEQSFDFNCAIRYV